MQIPKLDKVVISVACGRAKDNEEDPGKLSWSEPDRTIEGTVCARARKSVANFKLRQALPSAKVTLRGGHIARFVDRWRRRIDLSAAASFATTAWPCGIKQIISPDRLRRCREYTALSAAGTDEKRTGLLKAL